MSERPLVGHQSVGPELDLGIPSADPNIGIEEIERRKDLISDPGPTTRLPPDVMEKRREQFFEEYSGFWVINCANTEFSTKCDCPNFRIIEFFRTSEAADEHVRKLMVDPRVTSIPIKLPANIPFQIPVSEASAMDVEHTLSKIRRNLHRYDKFVEYRNDEFQKHVTEKTPGEVGKSIYSRRKAYLERQKNREQARDGIIGSAPITVDVPEPKVVEVVADAATKTSNLIWTGPLPEHWLKREGTVTADAWPRDLEARHGRFAIIAFIEDEDEVSDAPAYPTAAKREPIVIVFGGMHESIEAAKEFVTKRVAPWCPDLTLDVVDMYEWLWPTEVDPDAVEEQHRTNHAGYDKELNTVMTTRKQTLKNVAEAKEMGSNLRVNNVNTLPDIGDVVSQRREGMVTYEVERVEDEKKKPDESHLKSI